MYTPDLSAVRFSGPLIPFAPGWRNVLLADGYALTSAAIKLQLVAHLSRFLANKGLGAWDLTGPVIEEFLMERRATYTSQISLEALKPFLDHLRSLGAIPARSVHVPATPQEILMAEYQNYLNVRRGLTAAVISAYGRWISPFLDYLQAAGCRAHDDEVTGQLVADYLGCRLESLSRKSAKMTASVTRSFLEFLHASEYSSVALAATVPPVVSWRLAGLPQTLNRDEVAALLAAADRSTTAGKRDYAVVLLLVRLGMRRSEVARLQLDDLDWNTGTVVVYGKGGRIDTLPLPVDVGTALADYLRDDHRPKTDAREVFLRIPAPFRGLSPVGISYIVARLSTTAGLGTVYAHRLRHTAASNVLNAGADMDEVAQFLRHASTETSAVYAKTDMRRLSALTRPWPAAAGGLS